MKMILKDIYLGGFLEVKFLKLHISSAGVSLFLVI